VETPRHSCAPGAVVPWNTWFGWMACTITVPTISVIVATPSIKRMLRTGFDFLRIPITEPRELTPIGVARIVQAT
jgi:hypothetical protein